MKLRLQTLSVSIVLILAGYARASTNGVPLFSDVPDFTLSGFTSVVTVAVGDLNEDGKPDLAVSVRTPGANRALARKDDQVALFHQKAGTYAAAPDRRLAVETPSGIQIGDFDGDGTNDLVVLTHDSPIHVFPGSGRFENRYSAHSPNAARSGPIACRLNTAGLYDFLCGPVWFKWWGGARISSGYLYGPQNNDILHSQPADLNLDGSLDLLITPKGRRAIRLYYGPFMGQNVFATDLSQVVELPTPRTFGGELAVGDFNDDGRPDILAGTTDSRKPADRMVFMFYQNAPLGFTTNVPPRVLEGVTGRMAVGDLNRDGLDDLVVSGEAIFVFLQKKGRPFAATVGEADQVFDGGGRDLGIILADFDGDGSPDLVVWDGASTIRGYANTRKVSP